MGRPERGLPRRPLLPRGRLPNAYAAPSYPLLAAAARAHLDPDMLYAAAEQSRLPPWIAAKPGRLPRVGTLPETLRWRFAASASATEIVEHAEDRWLWLERVHPDDSDLTAAWASDPDIAAVDIAQIAEWCRCAPAPAGPLQASPGMFALWCADHNSTAALTAHRHRTLTRWFAMLRSEGVAAVADRHPAEDTRIEVVASAAVPVFADIGCETGPHHRQTGHD